MPVELGEYFYDFLFSVILFKNFDYVIFTLDSWSLLNFSFSQFGARQMRVLYLIKTLLSVEITSLTWGFRDNCPVLYVHPINYLPLKLPQAAAIPVGVASAKAMKRFQALS